MSMLLSQSGAPIVELGGARAYRQFIKGDIICSLQWLDIGHESREAQACMVLFPANRKVETRAFALPQQNAHLYVTNKGIPTALLVGAAFKGAIQMGFHPDRSTVKRIIDICADAMEELVKMPSSQPRALDVKQQHRGVEVTISQGGRVIGQALH